MAAAYSGDMFRWYTLQTYSGHENKVRENILQRADSYHIAPSIRRMVIPTETVTEIKDGHKISNEQRTMPGYLFIEMDLNDDNWTVVSKTAGVVGFVGAGEEPIPLTRAETDRLFGTSSTTSLRTPRAPAFVIGETVRVTAGPMADFNGQVAEINADAQRLRILVSIFGRETPVEVGFNQVKKTN
jgi:transcriptional antiterminator NusG